MTSVVFKSIWLIEAWGTMALPWALIVIGCLALVGLNPPIHARVVNGVDAFRSWWRRESLSCPNAGCYEAIALPVFVCPACGERHADLQPSSQGVHVRVCKCGKRLPTRGADRAALPALCPHCEQPLSVVRVHTARFALVAGPSAGKTSYLVGLMKELHEQSQLGRIGLTFADKKSQDRFELGLEQLAKGVQPHKTPETSPDAFIGQLRDLVGNSVVFHVYDAAGELWQQTDLLRDQAYLEKCAGLLLILDPFTLPDVQRNHAGTLAPIKDQVKPSEESPQQALDRLVVVLRERLNQQQGVLDCPIAVVITKADALGLIEEIDGGRGSMGSDWRPLPHSQVRDWLERNGGGNLIRGVEAQFKQVGFFACSALGRLPDASSDPYVPRAVIHPMAWLLARQGIQLEQAKEVVGVAVGVRRRWMALQAAAVALLVSLAYAADAVIFTAGAPVTLRATAAAGLTGVTSRILAAGGRVDAADEEGNTPLLIAAARGHVGVATMLLDRGAAIEAKTKRGETPLLAATATNVPAVIDLLLRHHANVNARQDDGRTPLFHAVRHGDAELTARLLAAGADPNTASPDQLPVLVEAYGHGLLPVVKALLAKGADPDAQDGKGLRLLHLAVREGKVDMAAALLSAGANPAAPDPEGISPMLRAIRQHDEPMISLLIERKAPLDQRGPDGEGLIYHATKAQNTAVVARLLKAGMPVPPKNAEGTSLVACAMAQGDRGMVEAVLKGGASARIANLAGDYPLHEAANASNVEFMRLLLQYGASVADTDGKGRDLGLLAADKQDIDLLNEVVPVARVRARTSEGDTLMTRILGDGSEKEAAGYDYQRSVWVRKLIARGASPNAANGRGDTPLHVAIRKGFNLTATELLNAGADFERANHQGQTPENLAEGTIATQIAQIKERREAARIAAEEAKRAAEEARRAAEEARAAAREAERQRVADELERTRQQRDTLPARPDLNPPPLRYGEVREVEFIDDETKARSTRKEIWDGSRWCPVE